MIYRFLISLFTLLLIFIADLLGQELKKTISDSMIFSGQISAWSNYNFDSSLPLQAGVRYIPTLNYNINFKGNKMIDFEGAANIYGTFKSHLIDTTVTDCALKPYRGWARFSAPQFEFRVGLQKIDFGSSTLLRALQWFNEIDPRDPLKLTNGVYGALGRYYFLNNANVWLWLLYGNVKTRGFDAVQTNKNIPEYGGRIQYPTSRGEIAASYHHRIANAENIMQSSLFDHISEYRFGLDGKWDLKIGLWFEATYILKHKNIGLLTNQSLFNLGADYTFNLGNGLNVVAENLFISYSEKAFKPDNNFNITAITFSYPPGLFDNLSNIIFYNWNDKNLSFFINYSHQFKNITGYIMAYYNPKTLQGIQQNELINTYPGPGIQFMVVYNH
jgi:hypothetical protein